MKNFGNGLAEIRIFTTVKKSAPRIYADSANFTTTVWVLVLIYIFKPILT